jgi:hypothetical protein
MADYSCIYSKKSTREKSQAHHHSNKHRNSGMLDEFDYICLYHTTMVCHNNMETFTCDAKGDYKILFRLGAEHLVALP